MNSAFTSTVRAALDDRPDLVDPRRYLTPARVAMADTVCAALRLLAGFSPGDNTHIEVHTPAAQGS